MINGKTIFKGRKTLSKWMSTCSPTWIYYLLMNTIPRNGWLLVEVCVRVKFAGHKTDLDIFRLFTPGIKLYRKLCNVLDSKLLLNRATWNGPCFAKLSHNFHHFEYKKLTLLNESDSLEYLRRVENVESIQSIFASKWSCHFPGVKPRTI